jgi:hypothetical protein
MPGLSYQIFPRSLQDVLNLHEKGRLNLKPGFQRDSVWTQSDRQKLIDSILRGFPLPSIFLYKRDRDGQTHYDVVDGKQRLETILMFTGQIRGKRFWTKAQLPGDDEKDWVDWNTLRRRKRQHLVESYRLQTVEVDGDLSDVIDLFVRINSTGKALTAAEKRKAKYYEDPFLREAARLARRYAEYFKRQRILSASQILRMKDVELMCELMISIHKGDVINKKAAVDRVMESKSLTTTQITKTSSRTVTALNRVARMFPNLVRTRFSKISDFYSLVVLISKLEAERLILTDRRRNRLAWELLLAFSTGVDTLRERQRRVVGAGPGEELYRNYLLTVLEGTDELSKRQRREQILRGLLASLFEKIDTKRLFSPEQRRILFNTAEERKCATCGRRLGWDDFTADHVHPFSKGGRTDLRNAALLCRTHNSAKGNRLARHRRAA